MNIHFFSGENYQNHTFLNVFCSHILLAMDFKLWVKTLTFKTMVKDNNLVILRIFWDIRVLVLKLLLLLLRCDYGCVLWNVVMTWRPFCTSQLQSPTNFNVLNAHFKCIGSAKYYKRPQRMYAKSTLTGLISKVHSLSLLEAEILGAVIS